MIAKFLKQRLINRIIKKYNDLSTNSDQPGVNYILSKDGSKMVLSTLVGSATRRVFVIRFTGLFSYELESELNVHVNRDTEMQTYGLGLAISDSGNFIAVGHPNYIRVGIVYVFKLYPNRDYKWKYHTKFLSNEHDVNQHKGFGENIEFEGEILRITNKQRSYGLTVTDYHKHNRTRMELCYWT